MRGEEGGERREGERSEGRGGRGKEGGEERGRKRRQGGRGRERSREFLVTLCHNTQRNTVLHTLIVSASPRVSRYDTTEVWPVAAARCSGVEPTLFLLPG